MTESSSADQGYWVSPFEELAQQEDTVWDETQGSGGISQQSMIETPGGDASTFDGQQSYDDTSVIRTQEYMDTHAPAVDPGFGGPDEGMLASWYGPGFHGSPTASGELFNTYGFTAAHPSLPFGTELVVSYGENSVLVTVNDRGPFTGDRELNLSEGAAQALGLTQAGVDFVQVSYPDGDGYGAGSGTPAVDTPYTPPNTYEPNVPIAPGDGVFTPEGREEISAPYEEFATMEDQPEVWNDGLAQVGQTQAYAPNIPPETFQDPYAPGVDPTFGDQTQAYAPSVSSETFQEPYAPPAVDSTFGGSPMLASWYGPGFHGSPTASGVPFDPYGFTAAHPSLPFGTELVVSYGGNSVPVTINDRGPFTGGRELDLSEGAAQALGLTNAGVDFVQVSYPGGGGYGAGPSTPPASTAPVTPYDPNVPINPGWEFDDPYDDDLYA